MPVFFIHSHDVDDGTITITEPLLSHIAKSLRAKPGDPLLFNDDQEHRYHTTVEQITKKTLHAIIHQIEAPPLVARPHLYLAQALLKGEKMGWVIQKATELGVTGIIPLITDRVILKLTGKQEEAHQARWKRIALEAAQQSERWTLPNICPIQSFQHFLETRQQNSTIFMAERDEGLPLLAIPYSTENQELDMTVMIGPEGGWSEKEVKGAKTHKWVFASFGKEILRAETASLAALAILQARFNT